MLKSHLRTPFPWYTDAKLRFRNKKSCSGQLSYKLITPNTSFLPFLIKLDGIIKGIMSLRVYNSGTGALIQDVPEVLNNSIFQRFSSGEEDCTYIQYNGTTGLFDLSCGFYVAELQYVDAFDAVRKVYSEEFYCPPVFDEDDYVTLKWKHSCDTLGILYQKGYENIMYLEGDIEKSEPTIDEEGIEDGLGNFYPTRQKFVENLRIDEIAPEFVADALALVQMHNTVNMNLRGLESGEIVNVRSKVAWENACLANIEMKFQQVVQDYSSTSCCQNKVIDMACAVTVSNLMLSVGGSGNNVISGLFIAENTASLLRYEWWTASVSGGAPQNIGTSTSFVSTAMPSGIHTVYVRAICTGFEAGNVISANVVVP
jgi:hypothetical protein